MYAWGLEREEVWETITPGKLSRLHLATARLSVSVHVMIEGLVPAVQGVLSMDVFSYQNSYSNSSSNKTTSPTFIQCVHLLLPGWASGHLANPPTRCPWVERT